MALHLVVGSANAGKTGVVHARVREAVADGSVALLLLPSPPDVSRAMRELAPTCASGLSITTIGGYLDGLWRSAGDGRGLVTPAQRAAILEESVNAVHAGSIAGSASSPGFTRMLGRLVQRAAASGAVLLDGDERAGDPGSRLLACMDAYFASLREVGLAERAEAYGWLADHIGSMDLPDLIAVNRFTGLTQQQERFLLAASSRCDVIVSLTYDRSIPATEAAAPLVSRLGRVGTMEVADDPRPRTEPTELIAVEQGGGVDGERPVRPEGAVLLSEAWGEAAEASRIVREIQYAVAAGVPPGAIAVVYRDPAAHVRMLRLALAEAGIPAEWDIQSTFERTGLGRAVLALLQVAVSSADRVTWMDLMRSPYSPGDVAVLDEMDAAVRRSPVADEEAGRLLTSRSQDEMARFLRSARDACARLGEPDSERLWHSIATGMLGRAHSAGSTLALDGMLDCAAARVVAEAVAGLRGLPHAALSAQGLAAALRSAPVSVTGTGAEACVQVMSAERIRGRRFRCVIVGGLTAGEFPRPRDDDSFGALGAREALARAGIDTAPGHDTNAERLLFYQVATRASERLVLSRQSHDAAGRPVQASIFVEELLDLYREAGDERPGHLLVPTRVLGLDESSGQANDAPITDRRRARAAACSMGEGGAADGAGGAAARRRREDARSRAEGAVLGALAERETFSVTDIEMYLQCPYRWFIERVIRPGELDVDIDASTSGRFAHAVMSETYDRFIKLTGCSRVDAGTLPIALETHGQVSADLLADIRPHTAAQAADLQRTARRTAHLLEVDATLLPGMSPAYREWSFGMDDGDEPEQLDGYGLVGRIDRIDTDGSQLVVTDYKLGTIGAGHGAAKLGSGRLVQLPLYALVASRRLKAAIAGAVYRSVSGTAPRGFVSEAIAGSPFVSTDVLDTAALEALLSEATAIAKGAVDGMRSGSIPAAPADGRCVPYCRARAFCSGWRSGDAGTR